MKIPASLLQESSWRAALFILTSSTFRKGDPDVWNHINLTQQLIFFKRILKGRGWSSTEALMIRAAWSLFTSGERNEINLYYLVNRLDDRQFQTLLDAMLVFRNRNYVPPCGLLHQNEAGQ